MTKAKIASKSWPKNRLAKRLCINKSTNEKCRVFCKVHFGKYQSSMLDIVSYADNTTTYAVNEKKIQSLVH